MSEYRPLAKQLPAAAGILVFLGIVGFVLLARAEPKDEPAQNDDRSHVTVGPDAARIVNIETQVAKIEAESQNLKTTGLVLYPADRTVKVAPRLQGRVRDVLVKVGDRVREGQPLAVIESVDAANARNTQLENESKARLAKLKLDTAEEQFRLGTPEVESAKAALGQAKEAASSAEFLLKKAREQAKIGGFTEKPLEDAQNSSVAAQSALSQAQADLALAQKDFDRKKQLFEIGVAAKADLEVSEDTYQKALETVRADQESLNLAREALAREQKAYMSNLYADQQVEQLQSSANSAELQVVAGQRALRLAQAAIQENLQQARSDAAIADMDLANSTKALELLGSPAADGSIAIPSPISGVVTERDVNPGQVVDQSQMTPWQMLVISNTDPIWVDADVFEKDLARLRVGESVEIQIAAIPGKTFRGSILHIEPTIDKTTHAMKARAEISNPAGELKDGMLADVVIHLASSKPALMVPLTAIVRDGDKDYIYVRKGAAPPSPAGLRGETSQSTSGAAYDRRPVTLGSINGDDVEVLDGLNEGETFVTHGALFIGSNTDGG